MGGLWQEKLKGDKSWNSFQRRMVGKKSTEGCRNGFCKTGFDWEQVLNCKGELWTGNTAKGSCGNALPWGFLGESTSLRKACQGQLGQRLCCAEKRLQEKFPESSSRFKFCILFQSTNKGFPEQNAVCELSDLSVNSEHQPSLQWDHKHSSSNLYLQK